MAYYYYDYAELWAIVRYEVLHFQFMELKHVIFAITDIAAQHYLAHARICPGGFLAESGIPLGVK